MRLRAFRSTWQPIRSRIQEINWCLNEWPWPLFRGRIKVMSTITLHSTLNISENVRGYGSKGPRTNWKWYMGYQMVTWPMTSRDLERSNSWPPICLEHNISKTAGFRDSVRTTNRKWHIGFQMVTWPTTSRDPKLLWGSTVGYLTSSVGHPSDSLASCVWCRRVGELVSPGIISFTYLTHMPEF